MKKVKYTRRDKSLFSGCELEDLYMIKDFPIHMLEESRLSADDPCCDMVFSIGKGDDFVELGIRQTM